MNRNLIIIPVLMVLFGARVFTQAPVNEEIPECFIRNNRFFVESVRLTMLAQQAYEEGNYLAFIEFSEEAVRFAALSDEFVQLQLKIRETDNTIAAARVELNLAASVDAARRYPNEYRAATAAFAEARSYRAAEAWDNAIDAALRAIAALINITEIPPAASPPPHLLPAPPPLSPAQVLLPAQHTVWLDDAIQSAAASLSASIDRGSRIAVVAMQSDSEDLSDYLVRELIHAFVILQSRHGFRVMARTELDPVLEQLAFNMSDFVDDATAAEAGEFLAVRYIAVGEFQPIAGFFRFRVRMIQIGIAGYLASYVASIQNDAIISYLRGTVPELESFRD